MLELSKAREKKRKEKGPKASFSANYSDGEKEIEQLSPKVYGDVDEEGAGKARARSQSRGRKKRIFIDDDLQHESRVGSRASECRNLLAALIEESPEKGGEAS